MNVLVVGGAGYVGGGLVDRLLIDGHNVRVYDSLLYEESYRKSVDFVFGDVRDIGRLQPQLNWADAVVWLAAIVGDGACELNPDVSKQVNQDSVKHFSENFDGRIIFLSTCSVYGFNQGVLNETSEKNPLSVYAATKLAAEKYVEDKGLIFRLGTLFGVGDSYSRIRFDLVVNTMTVRAFQSGKISVFGGEQFRPLLHVLDVADVIADNVGNKLTGIYNLHKQNVRITDLAYQVRNHFPYIDVETKDIPMQDARSYQVSSDKAIMGLGFHPKRTIDFGIDQLKELMEEIRLCDLENSRYTNQTFLSKFNPHLEVRY